MAKLALTCDYVRAVARDLDRPAVLDLARRIAELADERNLA
jgi:hypothetical protein